MTTADKVIVLSSSDYSRPRFCRGTVLIDRDSWDTTEMAPGKFTTARSRLTLPRQFKRGNCRVYSMTLSILELNYVVLIEMAIVTRRLWWWSLPYTLTWNLTRKLPWLYTPPCIPHRIYWLVIWSRTWLLCVVYSRRDCKELVGLAVDHNGDWDKGKTRGALRLRWWGLSSFDNQDIDYWCQERK